MSITSPLMIAYSSAGAGYPNRGNPCAHPACSSASASCAESQQNNNQQQNNGCNPYGAQPCDPSTASRHHPEGLNEMVHACRHYVMDRLDNLQDALPGLRDTLIQVSRFMLRGMYEKKLLKPKQQNGNDAPFPVEKEQLKTEVGHVAHEASRFIIER